MAFLESYDFTLGSLLTNFLIGFTTLIFLYWYSTRTHGYWKKKGIPFTPTYPVLGSIYEYLREPLQFADVKRHNKYGLLYGHFEGTRPLLSVADPKLLKEIFVKDFHAFTGRRSFDAPDDVASKMVSIVRGEDWKRIRSIITPTFTTGKIKKMLSIFKDCSKTVVQNFTKATEKGESVELKSLYGAFTMDIIASSAFSMKIDSHNDPNNEFVAIARRVFLRGVNWRLIVFLLCPSAFKTFGISLFPPEAMKFYTSVTLQAIEERRKTGQTRNDFLQLLMDTAKEANDERKLEIEQEGEDIAANYGKDDSQQMFKNIYSKKSLSMDELVAQCIIFFLAGYDTTASTLSFATYSLALNEDIQDKLAEEVDEAIKENDGELTYDAIQSMKYMDNIISETLRMYPPLVRLERMADEDYKLGDTGLTIPKGMLISIPVYAMHRDPNLYPDPEKFDPDRFTPEERTKRDQYTYLPFGAGPRNCVGMRFALMEIKVCLAYVVSHFRVKRCAETKVPLDYHNGQGVLQPKAVNVKLEIRKDNIKPH